MKKKLISALLTLCMVLSLLPASALAAETLTPDVISGYGFLWNGDEAKRGPFNGGAIPGGGSVKADNDWMGQTMYVAFNAKDGASANLWFQIKENNRTWGCAATWAGKAAVYAFSFLNDVTNPLQWEQAPQDRPEAGLSEGTSVTLSVYTTTTLLTAESHNVSGLTPFFTTTFTLPDKGEDNEGKTQFPVNIGTVEIANITLEAGGTFPTEATVTTPADDVTAKITWTTENNAAVDATVEAGNTYTAKITVTPKQPAIKALADSTTYKVGSTNVDKTKVTLTNGVATFDTTVTVPVKYTVTFNTNGGSTISPQEVTSGGNVTKPDDPTRTGFKFDGWFTTAEGTSKFDFTQPITADTTLYAKWTENVTPTPTKYTVSFNAGDGTGTMAAVEVEKAATGNTTYTLPECTFTAPTDKTFAGWKVGDANGVQPAGAVVTLTADTTMTAIWADEAKADAPVEVTNNTATATVTAPATVKAGDVVTIDASKGEDGNEIPANVTSSEIQLPKADVDKLSTASSVEITTPTGTVTLPQAALTTIANDVNVTNTAPATLTVAQTSEEAAVTPPSTSTEVKATFEVKVSVGNHEIELSASDLNNQFIKLALNIGRGLTNPAVYYVEDNGRLGAMLGVGKAYNPTDGSITVLAPHLSNFAVVASKQTTGDLALTSGVKEGNFVSTTLTGMTAGNYYLVQTKTDSSHFTFITFKAQDTSMKFTVNSGNTVEVWESKTDITFNGYVPTTDGTGHVDATTITAAN